MRLLDGGLCVARKSEGMQAAHRAAIIEPRTIEHGYHMSVALSMSRRFGLMVGSGWLANRRVCKGCGIKAAVIEPRTIERGCHNVGCAVHIAPL